MTLDAFAKAWNRGRADLDAKRWLDSLDDEEKAARFDAMVSRAVDAPDVTALEEMTLEEKVRHFRDLEQFKFRP